MENSNKYPFLTRPKKKTLTRYNRIQPWECTPPPPPGLNQFWGSAFPRMHTHILWIIWIICVQIFKKMTYWRSTRLIFKGQTFYSLGRAQSYGQNSSKCILTKLNKLPCDWNGTDLYREDILWFVFANTCSQLLARTIKRFILASGFKDDNDIHKCHSNPVWIP